MKKYPNELACKWGKYREKCSAESDSKEQEQEQERLGRTFKTEMRTIAREAKKAYEEYKERAATQQ